MNIEFIEKEVIHQEQQTKYWFNVDGEDFCLAEDYSGWDGALSLLDTEGFPIEDCNDHDGIKSALISARQHMEN